MHYIIVHDKIFIKQNITSYSLRISIDVFLLSLHSKFLLGIIFFSKQKNHFSLFLGKIIHIRTFVTRIVLVTNSVNDTVGLVTSCIWVSYEL